MVSTEIEKLEKKIQKQEEKIKPIEEKMKPLQKRIKNLEDYALANHHKWSRERILEESQKLTNVCIELADLEDIYKPSKKALNEYQQKLNYYRENKKREDFWTDKEVNYLISYYSNPNNKNLDKAKKHLGRSGKIIAEYAYKLRRKLGEDRVPKLGKAKR